MKRKDLQKVNYDEILKFLDKMINHFVNYIDCHYNEEKQQIVYEVFDDIDYLPFRFLNKDTLIERLNEYGEHKVSDYMVFSNENIIRFYLDTFRTLS